VILSYSLGERQNYNVEQRIRHLNTLLDRLNPPHPPKWFNHLDAGFRMQLLISML